MGASMLPYPSAIEPAPARCVRGGDRLYRTIRRPLLQRRLAQQRGLGRPANRGHRRRPRAPGSRREADQKIGLDDATGMVNRPGTACGRDTDRARSMFEAALRIGCRTGDNRDMAYACLGLACLAGETGRVVPGPLALHGVAPAYLDRAGLPWDEDDADYRQDSLDQAARTWAISGSSRPTPVAGRSSSTRPSNWHSAARTQNQKALCTSKGRHAWQMMRADGGHQGIPASATLTRTSPRRCLITPDTRQSPAVAAIMTGQHGFAGFIESRRSAESDAN